MKDENFYAVQGWMINRLNLKGNELHLYAIIYGFSQDGESEYYGSQRYIAKALSISKTTANSLIKKLLAKKLIKKVSKSHYKAYQKLVQDVPETGTASVPETGTASVPETGTNKYNTNYNNNYNNVEEKSSTPLPSLFDYDMVEKLKEYIIQNNPLYQRKEFIISKNKWANDFRLMRERDKLTEKQIEFMIDWSQRDSFWKTNILSPSKLRKQMPKLILQAKSKTEGRKPKLAIIN